MPILLFVLMVPFLHVITGLQISDSFFLTGSEINKSGWGISKLSLFLLLEKQLGGIKHLVCARKNPRQSLLWTMTQLY